MCIVFVLRVDNRKYGIGLRFKSVSDSDAGIVEESHINYFQQSSQLIT